VGFSQLPEHEQPHPRTFPPSLPHSFIFPSPPYLHLKGLGDDEDFSQVRHRSEFKSVVAFAKSMLEKERLFKRRESLRVESASDDEFDGYDQWGAPYDSLYATEADMFLREVSPLAQNDPHLT